MRYIHIIYALLTCLICNAVYYSILCHNFFTCSSVDKHLGGFQFPAIKNKNSVNIPVHVF